jgi:death-on-curing protein
MGKIKLIEKNVVLALHKRHLAEFGGKYGIISEGLLDSALDRAVNILNYTEPSISVLACSYAFGISNNHPFLDGNKRTALIVCLLFLRMNGYIVVASEEEKYDIFIKIATNKLSEEDFTKWLEARIFPLIKNR